MALMAFSLAAAASMPDSVRISSGLSMTRGEATT